MHQQLFINSRVDKETPHHRDPERHPLDDVAAQLY